MFEDDHNLDPEENAPPFFSAPTTAQKGFSGTNHQPRITIVIARLDGHKRWWELTKGISALIAETRRLGLVVEVRDSFGNILIANDNENGDCELFG